MLKKQDSIFRNSPRVLDAADLMKIAGGDWTTPTNPIGPVRPGGKAPYDLDYASRTFN